jgi:CheY-like chemotaxis protein
VNLPVAASVEKPAPPPPERGKADVPTLEGVSVLVVDDHPDALEIVSEILRRQKANVSTADSARRAIDLLNASRPDVLVTDIGMPECDGFALLREVRRISGNNGDSLPVIAVTAHARPEDRQGALDAGFQAHLTKPVDPRDLVAAVQLFSRGIPTSAHAE